MEQNRGMFRHFGVRDPRLVVVRLAGWAVAEGTDPGYRCEETAMSLGNLL